MANFEGNEMNSCPTQMLDFAHTDVVIVSGSGLNPCGHMLLSTGNSSNTSVYMHVAGGSGGEGAGWAERSGIRARPKWMNEEGFTRYLREQEKYVIRRFSIRISQPEAAMLKMEQLLAVKWTWGVLPNNCASFVEQIIRAGGNSGGLYSNCPRLAIPGDFD